MTNGDDVQDPGTGNHAEVNDSSEPESDLPEELAKPARRALTGAGYTRLEQLARLSEDEVLRLHGMGPKALGQIRRALAARGQSFADALETRGVHCLRVIMNRTRKEAK